MLTPGEPRSSNVCFVARKETDVPKRRAIILFTVGRNTMLDTGRGVVAASMEPRWKDHERRGRVGSPSLPGATVMLVTGLPVTVSSHVPGSCVSCQHLYSVLEREKLVMTAEALISSPTSGSGNQRLDMLRNSRGWKRNRGNKRNQGQSVHRGVWARLAPYPTWLQINCSRT